MIVRSSDIFRLQLGFFLKGFLSCSVCNRQPSFVKFPLPPPTHLARASYCHK